MSSKSSFSKTNANKKPSEASTSVSAGTGAIKKTASSVKKTKQTEPALRSSYALRSRVKISGDVNSGTLGLDSVVVQTTKFKAKVEIPPKPPKPARSLFVPDQPKVNVTAKPKVMVEIPSLSLIPAPESQSSPDQPKGNVYKCPICWNDPPLEPTTTKCGHIFCYSCIDKTLEDKTYRCIWCGSVHMDLSTHCCPLCKKEISRDDLIRIYLN